MAFATITSKGQTTIPKEVRTAANLKSGDRIHFTVLEDGTIIVRVNRPGCLALFRYWSAHAQPVICHPELPFFKDIITMALSVTGLPACVNVSVVGVTRYA
jgi:antitoxin PrlF